MKRVPVLALAVLAVALLTAGAASASPIKLIVSPTAPTVGSPVVFSGCGYTPGEVVQLQAVHNSKTATDILQVDETIDASGCFSTSNATYAPPEAGKWTANVFDLSNGHREATLIFAVS